MPMNFPNFKEEGPPKKDLRLILMFTAYVINAYFVLTFVTLYLTSERRGIGGILESMDPASAVGASVSFFILCLLIFTSTRK